MILLPGAATGNGHQWRTNAATMRLMPIAQDAAVASRRRHGFRLGVLAILLAIIAMHGVPFVGGAAMDRHDTPTATASTAITHPAAAPQLTASHPGDAMDHFLHLCLVVLGSLLLAIGVAGMLWRARRSAKFASVASSGYLSGRSPPHWWTIAIHRLCVSRT